MSSIFNRIFRYRQSKHRTPSEDYFTETFVAVLDRCKPLRIAFVERLIGSENITRENIESVRIETQKSFSEGGIARRPDIWVEARDSAGKRHVAIIENKIDSRQGENQLSDYAKILQREPNAESQTLVYITKYSEETGAPDQGNLRFEHSNTRFKHLKWFEVYAYLVEEQQKTAKSAGDLLKELLRLMEDWNMAGTLSAARLRAAVTCIGTEVGKSLHSIQNEAWTRSDIEKVLKDKCKPGRWAFGYTKGSQYSPPIRDYEVRIWIGFRFSGQHAGWDVDKLELPTPPVSLIKEGKPRRELPQPSENWFRPVERGRLWRRQPNLGEMPLPRYGEQLDEYYKEFFYCAFEELKEALGRDQ